ncbi:hypothetical protein [Haloferula sp.]|uniref:hypothetical protein n=1 Tax=Haloferula sp. TaxID=2497595 RepID=UPI00329FEF16
MNIQNKPSLLPLAAALGILLPLAASAAVQVAGVSNAMENTYSGDESATDLVNQGESSFSSVAYSSVGGNTNPHFGGPDPTGGANNNGVHGANGTNTEITFWLSASAGDTYTITYDLDTAVNTDGYDITSIQTIHAWTNNSGNQKNQNYTVEVSTVTGGAGFSNIATVAYLPFTDAGQGGASKVNITEDDTGILATGVDQIRFTYTVPAGATGQPSPTIREIDVFGTATNTGPDLTPPTLTSIADDQGGGPIMPNTLVTYTVSFSEDMDDTTVDSADFDNAGSAPVTFGSITESAPGIFTVEVTPTGLGTLQLRIPSGAVLDDAAGNPLDTTSDLLDDTIITMDDTAPTLAGSDIVDDRGGASVLLNKSLPLSYTVTFSEDMDAATVDAADFDNAGTASISIGSIVEGVPGVFTIDVTATSAGTVQLRVPMGAALSDAAGNALDTSSAIVDDTTITVDPTTVVVTPQSSLGTPFADTLWAGNLSATDLINAGESTLAAVTVSTAFFGGPNGINDGVSTGSSDSVYFEAPDNFPATAIYDLDLTTNTAGYDFTSIESFVGWRGNSGGQGNQTYQVEVSVVGSPDYVLLAVVNYEPFGPENSDDHESHVVIDDSSGTLASGVDSIRFTFSAPLIGGTAPGTVVREIDVFGVPSPTGPSDYDVWAALFPAADLTDPNADLDADGSTNDEERLFGTDPTDSSSQNPIVVALDPVGGTFSFTRRDDALTGQFADVETSTDLDMWTKDAGAMLVSGVPDGNGVETVAVTLSPGLLTGPKLFVRVTQDDGILLSQNFEADGGGFTVDTTAGSDWERGDPDSDGPGGVVSEGNGGSMNCWGTNITNPGYFADNTNTSLRSTVIDLTDVTAAELTFAEALDIQAGDMAVVNIIDDTTDALISAAIYTADDSGGPSDADWNNVAAIAMPAAALGQKVRIEWSFIGTDGTANLYFGWYIDDVTVKRVTP